MAKDGQFTLAHSPVRGISFEKFQQYRKLYFCLLNAILRSVITMCLSVTHFVIIILDKHTDSNTQSSCVPSQGKGT